MVCWFASVVSSVCRFYCLLVFACCLFVCLLMLNCFCGLTCWWCWILTCFAVFDWLLFTLWWCEVLIFGCCVSYGLIVFTVVVLFVRGLDVLFCLLFCLLVDLLGICLTVVGWWLAVVSLIIVLWCIWSFVSAFNCLIIYLRFWLLLCLLVYLFGWWLLFVFLKCWLLVGFGCMSLIFVVLLVVLFDAWR